MNMGMFDFLKKGKNETMLSEAPANTLLAVQNGTIVPVDKLPDPVFAEKVLGDGYAVDPTDGRVVSPVSGTIVDVQDSLHAYGIETDNGLEVLVHIGINTVSLNGEGFRTKRKVGDKIHAGELLATVDLELLKQKGLPQFTVVLITNMDDVKVMHPNYTTAEAGKTPALTYEK